MYNLRMTSWYVENGFVEVTQLCNSIYWSINQWKCMTHYVEAERARGAVTVPVVRQGTMADPTEVSPDLCRRVPETRERDKDEEGMRGNRKESCNTGLFSGGGYCADTRCLFRHSFLYECVCETQSYTHWMNLPINYLIHYFSLNSVPLSNLKLSDLLRLNE